MSDLFRESDVVGKDKDPGGSKLGEEGRREGGREGGKEGRREERRKGRIGEWGEQ